jgi:hypothetical protein
MIIDNYNGATPSSAPQASDWGKQASTLVEVTEELLTVVLL